MAKTTVKNACNNKFTWFSTKLNEYKNALLSQSLSTWNNTFTQTPHEMFKELTAACFYVMFGMCVGFRNLVSLSIVNKLFSRINVWWWNTKTDYEKISGWVNYKIWFYPCRYTESKNWYLSESKSGVKFIAIWFKYSYGYREKRILNLFNQFYSASLALLPS